MSVQERVARGIIARTVACEDTEMSAFVARFHTLCVEKGVDGERLHELTCENLSRKVRSLGRAATGAYTPTGGRDVRDMGTHKSAKSGKTNRARAAMDSHANGIDQHLSQRKYMVVLEREFCISKDRNYKRSVRQIARLLARDTALHLPKVFGGSVWYDNTLAR